MMIKKKKAIQGKLPDSFFDEWEEYIRVTDGEWAAKEKATSIKLESPDEVLRQLFDDWPSAEYEYGKWLKQLNKGPKDYDYAPYPPLIDEDSFPEYEVPPAFPIKQPKRQATPAITPAGQNKKTVAPKEAAPAEPVNKPKRRLIDWDEE